MQIMNVALSVCTPNFSLPTPLVTIATIAKEGLKNEVSLVFALNDATNESDLLHGSGM